jgi:hypothetical protein
MKRWSVALGGLVYVACTVKGEDVPQPLAQPAARVHEAVAEASPPLVLPLAVPGSSARVVRFELAAGIVDHEPHGVSTRFSRRSTPRVFAFVEVSNEGGKPTSLDLAFDPIDTDAVSTLLTLDIPNVKRWRTQVFMHTAAPGKYRAVLVSPSGEELGGRDFEVVD